MNLVWAILKHAFLAMQLEHDGAGLPTKFLGAFMLVSVYAALVVANSTSLNEDLFSLTFIVFIYLFVLRTQIIGLIVLIGIITGFIIFALSLFGHMSALQLFMVNALEYLLIFGGLINAIKRYANIN